MSVAVQTKLEKRQVPLLKIIVVVPDDDIIKCFKDQDSELGKPFSRVLNYIMTEHECCISAYKEYLPAKCVKEDYRQILWIQAPYHDHFLNNDQRYRFNKSIEELVRFHGAVHMLMLKKVWNPKDMAFYVQDQQ